MEESRKERERAQRRELLLEAAERVFGKKPFDEATMQEVAAEAQIGMQGLYEHFPSKQELYEGLMLQRAEAFQEKASRVLSGLTDPLDQLRALAAVYVETFRDRPAFLPVFIKERVQFDWGFTSRFGPKIHAIYRLERNRLRGILEKAVKRRILKPMDPEFLTQLCLDVLHSSLYYQHRHSAGEEVATCVDRATTCFLYGAGLRP
jgi:AcrR family transcriptional regulator